MATDLTLTMKDDPGQLAALGEALGAAGVNIEGLCAVTSTGKGEVHILVEDAAAAGQACADAGVDVENEREVLVVQGEDRPGQLGEIARKIADAGANIELAYLATGTRVVIGVDDMSKAKAAV